MSKFIHFGCWNKNGCSIDPPFSTELSKVMRQLRIATDDEQPVKTDFVVVAGDNYYPESRKNPSDKSVKEKKIISDDLVSGFECLPKNVPVHIILGNHDLEERVGVDEFMNVNENESEKCYIMDLEREIVTRNPKMTFNMFNSTLFNEKTLVIMIDTTMYDMALLYNIEDNLTCYQHFYKTTGRTGPVTLERLYTDQHRAVEQTVSEFLSDKIENIVVIGHHPITCLKEKGGKTKLLTNTIYGISKLLFEAIYQTIPDGKSNSINYFYLCADLHQYQIGEVLINGQMRINQYIVGTGGTTLDPTPSIIPDRIETARGGPDNFEISYMVTRERAELSGAKYGFLECYDTSNGLVFIFVDIAGDRLVEEKYSSFRIGGLRHKMKRKIKQKRFSRTKLKLKDKHKTKKLRNLNRNYNKQYNKQYNKNKKLNTKRYKRKKTRRH